MEIYRGDIFYVAKGKYQSSEQGGERPAIVVSNNTGNHFSDCVEVVYLTSQHKKSSLPTHVEVVCRCLSTALCEQIYTVHKDRLTDYVRSCTADEMRRIDDALKISLGLGKETPPEDESVTESHYKSDEYVLGVEEEIRKEDIIKLATERDIFKKLYEELLERVTSS